MHQRSLIVGDGTELSYEVTGPEGAPAILLCHGLGASGRQFEEDADWLGIQGFRVLVPDLRGHGGSGVPEPIRADGFSPAVLGADIMAMLDREGIGQVHWVGNSLGGIVGLTLAAAQTDRLASLCLFGTALALDLPPLGWVFALLDLLPGRAVAARITAANTTRNRAARPLIAQMLAAYDAGAAAAITGQIRRYDLRNAASGWAGPGLVLVGGRDHAVNRALLPQLDMLKGRPNWRIEHLAEGGHCANLDARDDWRGKVLNFVAEAAGAASGRDGAGAARARPTRPG